MSVQLICTIVDDLFQLVELGFAMNGNLSIEDLETTEYLNANALKTLEDIMLKLYSWAYFF